MKIREASFALRVVRRRSGDAAILYRRSLDEKLNKRLTRVAAISPLAYASAFALIRQAVKAGLPKGQRLKLDPGPFYPLDDDWGARAACYAIVAAGLRNADRLHKAATQLQSADPAEAAWWFGLLRNGRLHRTRRALRILLDAVN